MLDRQLKYGYDGRGAIFGAFFRKPACASARMDAGGEERFVRVDVSHARNKRLIEEKRFNVPFMALQSCKKFGEIDRKRVRPGALEESGIFGKNSNRPNWRTSS